MPAETSFRRAQLVRDFDRKLRVARIELQRLAITSSAFSDSELSSAIRACANDASASPLRSSAWVRQIGAPVSRRKNIAHQARAPQSSLAATSRPLAFRGQRLRERASAAVQESRAQQMPGPPAAICGVVQIGASSCREIYRSALVAQTLLVTVFLHPLPAFVLRDFGFPSLLK
jgi:hypothetical protein